MEGRELPVGWVYAPLLGLGELIRGVSYSKNDASDSSFSGSIPVLRANNIQDRHFDIENLVHVLTSLVAQAQIVKAGDVVIATSSGSISVVGKAAQAREDLAMAFGAFCGLIRPSNEISPEYFGHFFSSESYRTAVSDMARGVNINNLKKSHFESLNIPLPPLNEQRRIAAKLDTTLAAVDSCRQRLDGVAELLKRFRQAVLAAATSGELTREWREEKLSDKAWQQTKIDQIAAIGTGSTPLRSNPAFYGNSGIPWITSAATSAEIITSASEFVTEQGQAASRLRIYPEGTILVAMYGEGKTRGQVSELGIPATINQACAAIHDVIEAHLMPFIKIVLKANYLEMRDLAEGGNQPNLNLTKIKQFPIALPSKDEVFEICDRVESLFTLADQLEARLNSARKVVDRLTPALLAKAFRGELVPQDPADEPASVLLARIRAARQAEAGAARPSRRGRPKAAANPEPIDRTAAPAPSEPLPPDLLTQLLRECGALSERALLAASALEQAGFFTQLERELQLGSIRQSREEGQVLLEAVA
jgi:type I restriction enzyme S subunit